MIKLGLTGNKCAGKSTIADIFKSMSIPVFDADVIIKYILTYDYDKLQLIKNKVGEYVFKIAKDNPLLLNFDYLAKDGESYDLVLDLIEESIFDAYHKFNMKYATTGGIYTIFMCSILFERNWDWKMDTVLFIESSKINRINRYHNLTKNDFASTSSMMSTEVLSGDKAAMSAHIIYNNARIKDKSIPPEILVAINRIDNDLIDQHLYTF